jgi:PAS domain S-box-containing protein
VTTDVKAVRHEDGRVDFFVATVQDITARLQAEGFAQEILDNVDQGFVVYDRALRVVVWNRFLERAIGLPREAAIGRHLHELFPDARQHGIEALLARALAGEVVVADEFVPRLRGTTNSCAGGRGWIVATIRAFSGPCPPTRRIGTSMATSTASWSTWLI